MKQAGQLRAAQKQLLVCAQQTCPAPVAKECTRWLREVEDALPSVVLGVRDARGNDVHAVRVYCDGELLVSSLDGRAVVLDPGPHLFRYEGERGTIAEKQVVIHQAEKNRHIGITLGEKPSKSMPESTEDAGSASRPIPMSAVVLGSIGVVGLASFAYFGVGAKNDVDDLRTGCAPNCDQSDVDAARRKAVVADVSLGVGVVSLAVAGWILLQPSEQAGPQVRVGIAPGGVSLMGLF